MGRVGKPGAPDTDLIYPKTERVVQVGNAMDASRPTAVKAISSPVQIGAYGMRTQDVWPCKFPRQFPIGD